MAISVTGVGFCDDETNVSMSEPHLWHEGLKALAGQEIVLTATLRRYHRSLKANSYYWGVVMKAAVKETGQSADTIHCFWCEQFLPNETTRLEFFNKLTGQRIKVSVDTRRSSKLTGTKFYDYVEECRLWLQEWLGVSTPDPDPDYWRKAPKTEAA